MGSFRKVGGNAGRRARVALALGLALCGAGLSALAETTVDFRAPDPFLRELRAASATLGAQTDGTVEAQDLLAAARSDYARLLGALYARGHYSGVITVRIDGREAADIAPLDAPTTIRQIVISVDPGPAFVFSRADIAPLPPGTKVPKRFAPGKAAETGAIREAATAAVTGWRSAGHAKAAVGDQDLTLDHARNTLSADVRMAPGPRLRFGTFGVTGQDRMREDRIRAIAGFPEGQVFDPDKLSKSANRLRRAGVFRTVAITEAETPGPDGTLDIDTALVEELPRRFGYGGEIASFDGLDVSAFWIHRNLFGGAERLRIDGSISNIGAQSSGEDYVLGVTLERPATFTPDTLLRTGATASRLDDDDQVIELATFGFGVTQFLTDDLTLTAGIEFRAQEVSDLSGDYSYRDIAFPLGAVLDRRDDRFDATDGYFISIGATPFLGFDETDSGARLLLDGRAYHGFGEERPVVLAGRLQLGSILGAELIRTPRDYLFYSGGGGTVRGQPYQSLGVEVASLVDGQKIGGTQFLAASAEVRAMVTDTIGVVGFYDVGFVGSGDFLDDSDGDWHAGAGIGVRYATGFGPIRLDIAAPVSGDTGEGVQVYVGIGQAF